VLQPPSPYVQQGNAITEVIVAMLVLAPFIVGLPLLGKQLDVKHKAVDAARYSVWERTVWRDHGNSNRKTPEDITLEARDRALGSPRAGLLPATELRARGVTENPLWVDRQQRRLLNYTDDSMPFTTRIAVANDPVRVGLALVPELAYEGGVVRAAARLIGLEPLGLTDRAFAQTNLRLEVRPLLGQLAQRTPSLRRESAVSTNVPPLVQSASAAILSDAWSARDEASMRRLVDRLVVNEALEVIEAPGRPLGELAIGKGRILYGEGQFGWDPNFHAESTTLPRAYVHTR
jgi:hypothetical protein